MMALKTIIATLQRWTFPSIAALFLWACGGGEDIRDAFDRTPQPQLVNLSAPMRDARAQLRALAASPALCRMSLDTTSSIRVTPLPNQDRGGGCGLYNMVRVENIGVPIPGLGALTCATTAGLHFWIRDVVQPAAQRIYGSDVVEIRSYGTYACRPRNNQAGARLSEHGTANAVDIGGFTLRNGRQVSVLSGWRSEDPLDRMFLRELHGGACNIFMVVIGPDANAQHRDHFHFDMGEWPRCR